jgi:hypothetical protein
MSNPMQTTAGDSLPDEKAAHLAADVQWLRKTAQGVLQVCFADGSVVNGVTPVRAFPITDPREGFSLVDAHGHEVLWVNRLEELPHDVAFVLGEELQRRDFMPQISRLVAVSSYITPCEWHVQTDRGETRFTLKGEEDIRRLGSGALLITDRHGIHYLLRDLTALDKTSRKILDRFL